MTDTEIVDSLARTLHFNHPRKYPERWYSANYIEMIEGFWFGYLASLLERRAAQPRNAGDVAPIGESDEHSGDLAQRA